MRDRTTMCLALRTVLLLWVGLLPLQTRYFLHRGSLAGGMWEYGSWALYLTDVLLILALVLALFLHGSRLFQKPKGLPKNAILIALGMLAAVFLSIPGAVDVGVSLGMFLRIALGFVGFWLLVKSDLKPAWIAAAMILSSSMEGIVILVQFLLQSVPESTALGLALHDPAAPGTSVVETSLGRFLRPYGTLPHPNMVAGWLSVGLLAASGLYLRSADRYGRSLLLAAFSTVLFALLLTFSRSALLAFLISLLLLVGLVLVREASIRQPLGFLGFRRTDQFLGLKMMKLVTTSMLAIGVFILIFHPLVTVRTEGIGRLEEQSINERFDQFTEARQLLREHWVLGTGIGTYTKALHDDVDRTRQVWEYQPVHNVYVLLFVELGILGTLLALWATVATFRVTMRAHLDLWQRWRQKNMPWVVFTSVSLLALFLIGFLDHYLVSLPFGIMLSWLILGWWGRSLIEKE